MTESQKGGPAARRIQTKRWRSRNGHQRRWADERLAEHGAQHWRRERWNFSSEITNSPFANPRAATTRGFFTGHTAAGPGGVSPGAGAAEGSGAGLGWRSDRGTHSLPASVRTRMNRD